MKSKNVANVVAAYNINTQCVFFIQHAADSMVSCECPASPSEYMQKNFHFHFPLKIDWYSVGSYVCQLAL